MRVLITGAAGLIGQVLWRGLEADYDLVGVDREAPRGGPIVRADLTRLRSVARHFARCDAVVDLAGFPATREPWERILANNVPATVNAVEAAREAGVGRYVFASSNHVTGLYERDEPYASIVSGHTEGLSPETLPRLSSSHSIRPDSPYAVGKAFGESAARLASETGGPSAVCLRIGTVNALNRPDDARSFATLLTHRDLVQLVRCSLAAPLPARFGIYYGVSGNRWRFWEIETAHRDLGYEPQDDAERWR
jgi:NAD+ dependent glucose-6-phosphate dehydrogenase